MNHPYSEKPQNIEGKSIEKNAGIVVFIIGGVTYAEVSFEFNLLNRFYFRWFENSVTDIRKSG